MKKGNGKAFTLSVNVDQNLKAYFVKEAQLGYNLQLLHQKQTPLDRNCLLQFRLLETPIISELHILKEIIKINRLTSAAFNLDRVSCMH